MSGMSSSAPEPHAESLQEGAATAVASIDMSPEQALDILWRPGMSSIYERFGKHDGLVMLSKIDRAYLVTLRYKLCHVPLAVAESVDH